MKTIEYSFTEHSTIKITWDRNTGLYFAGYFIGETALFFAKEKTIQDALNALELMAPIFLGEAK